MESLDLLFLLCTFLGDTDLTQENTKSQRIIQKKEKTYFLNTYLCPEDQNALNTLKIPAIFNSKKKIELSRLAKNFKGISNNLEEFTNQEHQKKINKALEDFKNNRPNNTFKAYQKEVETAVFCLLTADDDTQLDNVYKPLLPQFKERIENHYKNLMLEQREK